MKINVSEPTPAPVEAQDEKPLSAQFCHGLALVSLIIAIIAAMFTVMSLFEAPAGFIVAASCAGSALIWWVIGDALVAVSRKK